MTVIERGLLTSIIVVIGIVILTPIALTAAVAIFPGFLFL